MLWYLVLAVGIPIVVVVWLWLWLERQEWRHQDEAERSIKRARDKTDALRRMTRWE